MCLITRVYSTYILSLNGFFNGFSDIDKWIYVHLIIRRPKFELSTGKFITKANEVRNNLINCIKLFISTYVYLRTCSID